MPDGTLKRRGRAAGLLLGALLCAGACTLKKQPPSSSDILSAVARHNRTAEPKDRIVCRRESLPNSHFKELVCRHQWQLDEGRIESRAAVDELLFKNTQPNTGGE